MANTTTSTHRVWFVTTESVFEHLAAIIAGFVMMIVGLALGVTIIMLPVGLVVGLLGAAIFVAGIFGHAHPTSLRDGGRL